MIERKESICVLLTFNIVCVEKYEKLRAWSKSEDSGSLNFIVDSEFLINENELKFFFLKIRSPFIQFILLDQEQKILTT